MNLGSKLLIAPSSPASASGFSLLVSRLSLLKSLSEKTAIFKSSSAKFYYSSLVLNCKSNFYCGDFWNSVGSDYFGMM